MLILERISSRARSITEGLESTYDAQRNAHRDFQSALKIVSGIDDSTAKKVAGSFLREGFAVMEEGHVIHVTAKHMLSAPFIMEVVAQIRN